MAKRQARFDLQDLESDPRLSDESPNLWDDRLGVVPRGLLTSAVRCFASNGYHATTTRDISTGVRLSSSALYVHFPSKELVLFEIVRVSHERALECVQGPEIGATLGAAERLRTLISRYTAWHARHHVAARVAQYELGGLTAEHYEEIRHLRHRTNDIFRAAVARGVEDGAFPPVDVNRVVRAMLSLSIDLIRWYRLDGADSPEQLGDFYADLALRMVSSPESSQGAERGGTAPQPSPAIQATR